MRSTPASKPIGILSRWFRSQGFIKAEFEQGKLLVSVYSMSTTIVHRLRERVGHITWYKESDGGSLIVFEVSVSDHGVQYEGYCPMLLFGIWQRKLAFKADAGWPFAYRAEGWRIAQAFQKKIQALPLG